MRCSGRKESGVSMDVFHPAVFADGQPFASGLQFFFADLVFFTRLQALGRAFVGGGHGAVALDVFFGFLAVLVVVLRMGDRKADAERHRGNGGQDGRDGEECLDGTKVCHKKVTLIGEVQTH